MPPSRVRALPGGPWDDVEARERDEQVNVSVLGSVQRKKNGLPVATAFRHSTQSTEMMKNTAQEVSSAALASSFNDGGVMIGSQWSTFSPTILRKYKIHHRLAVPTCFGTARNEITLLTPGISEYAPTRARTRHRQRVTKDFMAKAVRKDFNAMPATEMDVVTSFLYSTRNKDKPFRLRFGAAKEQSAAAGRRV